MSKGRRGPWSKEDKEYIEANADRQTPEEIAAYLERDPQFVRKYITRLAIEGSAPKLKSKNNLIAGLDIQHTIVWRELQNEFSEEELELFAYNWNRIIEQFKEDVLPTEELQIIDMCRIEILMHRALKLQRDTGKDIMEQKERIVEAREQNRDYCTVIQPMEMVEASYKSAFESLNKEYSTLLQRKTVMLQEMKATRKERIQKIESSKQTFLGWIGELLSNRNLRRSLGEYMEKMRIAVDLEEIRLMQAHKYADGLVDLPLLSAGTLEKLSANAEQAEKDKQDESGNLGS